MAKKKTSKLSRSAASTAGANKKTTKKKSTPAMVTKKAVTKKPTKKKTTKKPTAKKSTKKTTQKTTKQSTTKSTKKPTPKTTPKKLSMPANKSDEKSLEEALDKEWTIPQLKRVKTDLTKKDLSEFLQLLLEKRAEIVGNVQGMEDARNAALGDIAHMPLHMADVGTDNFDQEFTLGLMESEREMLKEIDEALVRLRGGYYGVCIESGRPIGKMRLEFAPWAKYCIEVARLREKRGW